MAELLLELFSEEIPAGMQGRAAEDLKRLVCDRLKKAGLAFERAEAFATPRRLTLVVSEIPEKQPDVTEERKGPRVGAPEKAVEGFLKSVGLTIDQVEVRDTPKGETYFAIQKRAGRPAAEVLGDVLPDALAAIPWPKSMRWGAGNALRWVRPLHRILCLFAGEAAPFAFGHLTAGDTTSGHRFLAPEPFAVTSFADYREKLDAAWVVLDAAERRKRIEIDAARLAEAEGLAVKPDPALVAENAGLVEFPVVLMGAIDPDFMSLPPEVLTTAMRSHQKYFSLTGKDGALAPRFLLVSNMQAGDGGRQITAGNERVLRARLADARFFWNQDCKRSLESRVGDLDAVVFHAKLGSVGEKAKRIEVLAGEIAEYVPGADAGAAERAALLAKADLTTGMVGEFPELQGVMGRYYAENDGEDAAVADAIGEHYSPKGQDDTCPAAPASVCGALADRIDTLVGFWAIDEKPTGSRDPYALRRAALGVIRLIVENGLRVPLSHLFGVAYNHLKSRHWPGFLEGRRHIVPAEPGKPVGSGRQEVMVIPPSDELARNLLDFFADRLKVHLREKGVRHDMITAVFAAHRDDDLVRLLARVDALSDFLGSDDGANLLVAYRRAANIVRIEAKKDKAAYDGESVDPSLLREADEKAVTERLDEISERSSVALAEEKFGDAMAALATLRAPVDAFFDNVTVNSEDAALRVNRLRLLSRVQATMNKVADFSKIEG